jgi:hypothetical protein
MRNSVKAQEGLASGKPMANYIKIVNVAAK